MSWRDADLAMRSNIEGMTAAGKVLWLVLALHRNGESGTCDPGHDTLMKETSLGRKALRAARELLKQLGVLDYTSGYSNSRDGMVSTKYHLLIYHGSPKEVHTFDDDYRGDDWVPEQPNLY